MFPFCLSMTQNGYPDSLHGGCPYTAGRSDCRKASSPPECQSPPVRLSCDGHACNRCSVVIILTEEKRRFYPGYVLAIHWVTHSFLLKGEDPPFCIPCNESLFFYIIFFRAYVIVLLRFNCGQRNIFLYKFFENAVQECFSGFYLWFPKRRYKCFQQVVMGWILITFIQLSIFLHCDFVEI